MPLITGFEIDNFRCFQKLSVGGLARVNLIVGANNSGKTALLDAVELLATKGDVSRLYQQLERRGEYYVETSLPGLSGTPAPPLLDAWQLRYGRAALKSNEGLFGIKETGVVPPTSVNAQAAVYDSGNFELQIGETGGSVGALSLVARRGISIQSIVEMAMSRGPSDASNVVYLGSNVPEAAPLARWWAKLAGSEAEDLVVEALRGIDERIERVVFAGLAAQPVGWEGWFLRLKGTAERVPIGGFGEGTKRLLGLALALASSAGGTLLVDEIENGLHHSVMKGLWIFLARAATKLNVQVFVASHSKDLLDAFDDARREPGQSMEEVVALRIDPDRHAVVRMSAATIAAVAHTDQELR